MDNKSTKRKQCVRKFSGKHQSIFLFVVEFQTLEEVLVASLFLVLFALTVNRQEFVELHYLLAPLLRSTQFFYGGICGIQVEGPKYLSKVDSIDDVGAIGIVNGEGEFCLCLTKIKK